jgi:hypothetical protein
MIRFRKLATIAAIGTALVFNFANAADMPAEDRGVLQESVSEVTGDDLYPLTRAERQSNHDPLDKAQPVPKVLAQGLTLFHDAIEGKKVKPSSFIHSLQTEDFSGRPFTYLNFVLPFHSSNLWLIPAETLDHVEVADSATTITGASTGRSLGYAKASDIRLLKEILLTAAAMGGAQSVKRIVSLQGYFDVFLENHDGQFWMVSSSPQLASREQVDTWRLQEKQMRQTLSTNTGYYTKLADAWQPYLIPSVQTKTSGQRLAMADLTLTDGSLDVTKAVQVIADRGIYLRETNAMEAKATQKRVTSSQQDYCWPFLWWTVCDWSTYGELSNSHVSGGKYQQAWMYGIPNWNVSGNDLLGCGPAAFISMTWWWWRYRGVEFYNRPPNSFEEPIYYRANFNGNDGDYVLPNKLLFGSQYKPVPIWPDNSIATLMVQPVNSSGRPQIADFLLPYAMGPRATATNPWDLHAGGQRFLDNQRARFSLRDVEKVGGRLSMNSKWISSIVGVVPIVGAVSATDYVYSIGSIINEHVGVRDNVVLALYPTGSDIVGGPHYSPILKYRIIWGAIQQAWITPVDDPAIFPQNNSGVQLFTLPFNSNRQYNMATPEGLAKGVFYFEVTRAANPREPRDN